MYYWAIASNLPLRVAWLFSYSQQFSWISKPYLWTTVVVSLEIFRRFQWNLIRVEHEDALNPDRYRAMRDVPQSFTLPADIDRISSIRVPFEDSLDGFEIDEGSITEGRSIGNSAGTDAIELRRISSDRVHYGALIGSIAQSNKRHSQSFGDLPQSSNDFANKVKFHRRATTATTTKPSFTDQVRDSSLGPQDTTPTLS
jgi:hypothetical protein